MYMYTYIHIYIHIYIYTYIYFCIVISHAEFKHSTKGKNGSSACNFVYFQVFELLENMKINKAIRVYALGCTSIHAKARERC